MMKPLADKKSALDSHKDSIVEELERETFATIQINTTDFYWKLILSQNVWIF